MARKKEATPKDTPKKKTIEYKGKTYELVFNLNVMEIVQEEYGSIDNWTNLFESEEGDDIEPNVKDLKFGLGAMLNEGIEIHNEDYPDDEWELLTDKQVGRVISSVGFVAATKALKNSVIEGVKSDEKN